MKEDDIMFGLEELFNSLIPSSETKIATMRADIIEHDTTYEARLDVPGFTKDEISVNLKDGNIIVTADKKSKIEEGTVVRERHSTMNRTFYLDGKIDTSTIKAVLENGVLTITADKAKEMQLQTIEIEAK